MAHLLNPRHRSIAYFGAARRSEHDKTLAEESLRYLRQQTGGDEELYQTLRTQLAEFLSREGDWTYGGVEGDRDAASCRGEKETSQVGQWWVQHGDGVPLLQSYAIRLTHTWTCASPTESPTERNWAVHERIQVKKRNQLGFIKLAHLVAISTNLRLSHCQGRGSGYVLPWEDAEEETEDSIPPPRDEGLRPADRVIEAQREWQVQRGHDLAVESEPGDSHDGGDNDPLAEMLRPWTRACTAAAAQHPPPPPPPPPSARASTAAAAQHPPPPPPLPSSGRASTGAIAQHPPPPTDRPGHGEQGTWDIVEEGRDDGDDVREGYEGSSEDEDDPSYSPTRGHGDDDDEGGNGTQAAGGLRRSGRQRADRCSGAGRGVGGARDTGAAGRGGGGRARRESVSSTRTVHWVDEGAATTEVGTGSAEFGGAASAQAAAEAAPSTPHFAAPSEEVAGGFAEVADEAAQVGSASAQLGGSFNGMLDVSLGFPPTPAGERGSGDADTAATPVCQILRDIPSCSMGDISSSMLQEAAAGTQGSLGLEECAAGDNRDCRPVQERALESEQDKIDREERERAQDLASRCEMTQSIALRTRAERMLETGGGSRSRGVEHFTKQKTYCPRWTREILYELQRAGVVLRDAISWGLASEYAERVEGVMAADDLRHYMEAEGGGEEEHTRPGTPSHAGGADASLTGGADGGDTCGGTISLADDLDAYRQRGGKSRGGTQPAAFEDAPPRVPRGVGGVSGRIEASGCSVSAAPASTSVVGRRQSTLDPYIGNKIKMDLDRLWALAIYRGGVAFNRLRLAETQQLWDYICTLFRCHDSTSSTTPLWATFGCTLMTDGAIDTTNKPIMNFIAAGDSGPILIWTIDMSHRDKTGISLAEIWEDVIRHDTGIENVNAICTDNAEVMKIAAHTLQTHPDPAMRHIPWIPCAAHSLSLLLRDIAAQPFVRLTTRDAHKIVKFMRNKQKALALHKVMKKALVLRRPAETRFGIAYMMLERLYDQREVLDTLVSSDRWARVRWAGDDRERMPHVRRLCRDDNFWSGVRTVMDVMGPVYSFLRDVDRVSGTAHHPLAYGIWRPSSDRDFIHYNCQTLTTSLLNTSYVVVAYWVFSKKCPRKGSRMARYNKLSNWVSVTPWSGTATRSSVTALSALALFFCREWIVCSLSDALKPRVTSANFSLRSLRNL
ncbi:hypothetical protein CBR_g40504 [Chara braunii]|uniref:DUF659 domain-containing protein n=1 Tax=Chara braunii TaxID=69332 RepID=A0A388K1Y3_CHABU|nr:hypothetical protein CBR_g40504 [Chara braunii]|eukprot:GBG64058.1 hypothetical protein CBR_g40504 [Chara braunii]